MYFKTFKNKQLYNWPFLQLPTYSMSFIKVRVIYFCDLLSSCFRVHICLMTSQNYACNHQPKVLILGIPSSLFISWCSITKKSIFCNIPPLSHHPHTSESSMGYKGTVAREFFKNWDCGGLGYRSYWCDAPTFNICSLSL